MNEQAYERQKRLVVAGFSIIMLGLAFYAFVKYALPLLWPFAVGFLLAVVLQKPLNFLSRKTPLKKGFWAAIMVLLLVGVVGYLLFLAGSRIYSQLEELTKYLIDKLQDIPSFLRDTENTLLDLCHALPDKLEAGAAESVEKFFADLLSKYEDGDGLSSFNWQEFLSNPPDIAWIKSPLTGIWNTAKQLPFIVVGILLTIISTIFTAVDYDRLVGFIKRQLPKEKRGALALAKKTIGSSVGKLLKSYLTIMCITFIEMAISLNLAKLFGVYEGDYAIAIALVVALVDILPVLGTGSVLVPWAIVSFATGRIGLGIWLLVTYAIITVLRQFLEPKLVADNLGLPPVLTLCGMYVGLQVFGFVGMFLLPVTMMLVKVLNDQGVLHFWKSGKRKPPKKTIKIKRSKRK
ncbi:MAG: sporulation integral membrane protein YtvI [Clostridium sp.]|jgi:sporulation integral membrane protein YtvI|nr:sporulation integral membrane protein YtvI [Clostridium sp.]